MERHTDGVQAYKLAKVNTAHPGKIVVMLYDELLKQLDFAIKKLEEGGPRVLDAVNTAILKAYDIVTELTVSLDMERGGEIGEQLYNLYTFFGSQLIKANVKKDPKILRETYNFIAELRESWDKVTRAPVADASSASGAPSAVDIHG